MRRTIMTLMLALSVCVAAFAQKYNKYEESYNYQRGLEAYSAGEYDEALNYMAKEVELHADNAYAYSYIAIVQSLCEEYGKALAAVNAGMRNVPKKDKDMKAFILHIRAVIYESLERYDEALADLNSAIALGTKSTDLYEARAELYSYFGYYAESDADYMSMLKIDGDNMAARIGLGNNAIGTEQYRKALDYGNEAVALYPDQPSAYVLRAKAYAGLKDYSNAASDIVSGIELGDETAVTLLVAYAKEAYTPLTARLNAKAIAQPNDSGWPFCTGLVNEYAKKYDLAVEAFRKSMSLETDDVVVNSLAECYMEIGDLDSALKYIDMAVEMDPEDISYVNRRAMIFWRMGERDLAVSEMTKCIEASPESDIYYYGRGRFKMKSDDLKGAIEDFTTAIVFNPSGAYSYLNRGCLYAKGGDTSKAEEDWKKCVEVDTESGDGSIALYAYFYLGQTDKAEEVLENLLKEDAEGACYNAACLYSLMKDKDKSVDYLRKALDADCGYLYNVCTDPDLDFVRESDEYKELVTECRDKCAAMCGSASDSEVSGTEVPEDSVAYAKKVVEVPFTRSNGVTKVKCDVNGLPLSFIFDTGAASVSISSLEATFMYKNGYLSSKDIVGKSAFMDANGDISVGTVINLRKVTFGGLEIENVKASVVSNDKAPLLLGQTVLNRLGKIEIDNNAGVLRIITKN